MQVVGWIVRTGSFGAARYWAVGAPCAESAVEIAGAGAGDCLALAIGKISGSAVAHEFAVSAREATELWKSNLKSSGEGELTFDTVVAEEGQDHIEGCYRVGSGDWKVYYLTHWRDGRLWTGNEMIDSDATFQSGIHGIDAVIPTTTALNKKECIRVISKATDIYRWFEIAGPNSLLLK